ncbi:MAG TPA: CbtB-domain containing protein [Stenomitos sp.]
MTYSPSLGTSVRRKAIDFTLSTPVQAALFLSLCSLSVWTLYFSTYPPAHNAMHQLRHGTAAVACH